MPQKDPAPLTPSEQNTIAALRKLRGKKRLAAADYFSLMIVWQEIGASDVLITMARAQAEAQGIEVEYHASPRGKRSAQLGPRCPHCGEDDMTRNGTRGGKQKWICRECKGALTTEPS
jgi:hypothetical protein